MKTFHALVPVLASITWADGVSEGFDLNQACIDTCQHLTGPKVFRSDYDRDMASTLCHDGCMDVGQQPHTRQSLQTQPRDVDANQTSINNDSCPGPSESDAINEACHTALSTLQCTACCPADDTSCGFDCFRNMTSNASLPQSLSARDNPNDNKDDSSGDDNDDDDAWSHDDVNLAQCTQQSVLSIHEARKVGPACFAGCSRADLKKGKFSCVDKCISDAGFTGDLALPHRDCVRLAVNCYDGDRYLPAIWSCQRKLEAAANKYRPTSRAIRRALLPSVASSVIPAGTTQWQLATTTWQTSGTMAMLVPVVTSVDSSFITLTAVETTTATATTIATALAVQTVSVAYMPLSFQMQMQPTVVTTLSDRQAAVPSVATVVASVVPAVTSVASTVPVTTVASVVQAVTSEVASTAPVSAVASVVTAVESAVQTVTAQLVSVVPVTAAESVVQALTSQLVSIIPVTAIDSVVQVVTSQLVSVPQVTAVESVVQAVTSQLVSVIPVTAVESVVTAVESAVQAVTSQVVSVVSVTAVQSTVTAVCTTPATTPSVTTVTTQPTATSSTRRTTISSSKTLSTGAASTQWTYMEGATVPFATWTQGPSGMQRTDQNAASTGVGGVSGDTAILVAFLVVLCMLL